MLHFRRDYRFGFPDIRVFHNERAEPTYFPHRQKYGRLMSASLFRRHRAVTHDDHFVTRARTTSGCAVETDDAAAGSAGDSVRCKALAVVDVDNIYLSYSRMPLASRRSLSMVIEPT